MSSIDYKALYEAKCVEIETLKEENLKNEKYWDKFYEVEWNACQKNEELKEKVEELEENVKNLTATLEMTMDNIKKCKTSCDGGVYGLVPQEEIEKLKDFTNWENHPSLNNKVVLDDDFYMEHLVDGELIHPEELEELKEERFRMCERANALGVDIYDNKEESEEESDEEDEDE